MQYNSLIQPRFIITLALLVALIMIGSAFFELRQSRSELFHLMTEEALSLAETIERSSENIILSTDQIESLLAERLFNNAYYISRLDSAGTLTQQELQRVCEANSVFRINIINRHGRRVMGSHGRQPDHVRLMEQSGPQEILKPLLSGTSNRLLIGLKEARFGQGKRFAVAVRRTHHAGGAIVLNMNVENFTELRRTIGIGKLMKDLGDNNGVEYALLQDDQGVLAASGSLTEIGSFNSDSLLHSAARSDTALTRISAFEGRDVFEVIQSLTVSGDRLGVIRIGLSMDAIRSAESRMQRRLWIISFVVFVLGALVVVALAAMRHAKQLQQEVERSQKLSAMGELAAGVAHEIRNPLNAISMIAQRYEREFRPLKGAKEYKKITGVLLKEIHRVNGIIQQFLRFARPPKLHLQGVKLSEFLSHISTLFQAQTEAKGVRFSVSHSKDTMISIDPAQITQALLNILQNALDATPPDGSIALSCSVSNLQVLVEITDSGKGMKADQLEKIFDLYYSTKPAGSGLGLSITRQIVELHGGTITVRSKAGKGTTVTLGLPM